jgi:hypothetical protein
MALGICFLESEEQPKLKAKAPKQNRILNK